MPHLAQVNISRLTAPLSDPLYTEFVARIDALNALAEQAPGFVWRLQTNAEGHSDRPDYGGATGIHIFNDPLLLVNLTVWESVQALYDYTYHSAHVEILKQRKRLFKPLSQAQFAMWWITEGHLPTIEEAEQKLILLDAEGESSRVFTFKTTIK